MNWCEFCTKYRYDPSTCMAGETQFLDAGCMKIQFYDRVNTNNLCRYCGLANKCNKNDGTHAHCESVDRDGYKRYTIDYKAYDEVRKHILAEIEIHEWERRRNHLIDVLKRTQPMMDELFK